jgi:hypothetical protein
MIKTNIWEIYNVNEGAYTKKIDKIFEEYEESKNVQDLFLDLVTLGDSARYGWQYRIILNNVFIKMKQYKIKLDLKKIPIKKIINERIAEEV